MPDAVDPSSPSSRSVVSPCKSVVSTGAVVSGTGVIAVDVPVLFVSELPGDVFSIGRLTPSVSIGAGGGTR